VARGGAVTDSIAPSLENATATEIAEAVRIGPYVMPAFPDGQISGRELDSIIRYVQYAENPDDRGGWAVGHIGPIPEGMVAWLIAGTVLVAVALLIAGGRKKEVEE
jgi:ubiquinol-cytochrome c reductase cytochrome c subunit